MQHLTKAQDEQWSTYLAPGAPAPEFPFLDVDCHYVSTAANVDVEALIGKSAAQIAAASQDPSTAIGKTVLGSANQITAAVCGVTGDLPSAVCTPQLQALRARFAAYHR